jgi:hypothetical protein
MAFFHDDFTPLLTSDTLAMKTEKSASQDSMQHILPQLHKKSKPTEVIYVPDDYEDAWNNSSKKTTSGKFHNAALDMKTKLVMAPRYSCTEKAILAFSMLVKFLPNLIIIAAGTYTVTQFYAILKYEWYPVAHDDKCNWIFWRDYEGGPYWPNNHFWQQWFAFPGFCKTFHYLVYHAFGLCDVSKADLARYYWDYPPLLIEPDWYHNWFLVIVSLISFFNVFLVLLILHAVKHLNGAMDFSKNAVIKFIANSIPILKLASLIFLFKDQGFNVRCFFLLIAELIKMIEEEYGLIKICLNPFIKLAKKIPVLKKACSIDAPNRVSVIIVFSLIPFVLWSPFATTYLLLTFTHFSLVDWLKKSQK